MKIIPDLPQSPPPAPTTRKRKILSIAAVVALIVTVVALQFEVVRRRLPGGGAPLLSPTRFAQLTGGGETITFSNDGEKLLVSGNGTTQVLDAKTGQVLQSWPGGSYLTQWSEDGRRVLEKIYDDGSRRTKIVVRDAATGKLLFEHKLTQRGWLCGFTRDFQRIVYTDQKNLFLLETATGRVLAHIPTSQRAFDLRFSRDGKYLFLPGQPSQVLRGDTLRPAFPQLKLPILSYLRLSADGKSIFGLEESGALHFWVIKTGQHHSVSTGLSRTRWFYSLKEGTFVVAGEKLKDKNRETVTQLRSPDGTKLLRELPCSLQKWSSNGRWILFRVPNTSNGRRIFRRDAQSYEMVDARDGTTSAVISGMVDPLGQPAADVLFLDVDFAIAPNGRQLAAINRAGLVCFYDRDAKPFMNGSVSTSGGRVAPEGAQILGSSTAPQVSTMPNGSTVTMGGDEGDFSSSRTSMISNGVVFDVQYQSPSPDGRKSVWFCQPIPPAQDAKPARATRFNSSRIEVRDATGHLLKRLPGGGRNEIAGIGPFNKPAWSSDSNLFAVSDQEGRIFWWDVRSGQLVGQLSCARADFKGGRMGGPFISLFFNQAARLAFSPDNRFLVAGRNDGSIYLYSLQSRLPVAQIGKAPEQLHNMGLSGNGRTLYGIPINGKDVLAWDVPQLNK